MLSAAEVKADASAALKVRIKPLQGRISVVNEGMHKPQSEASRREAHDKTLEQLKEELDELEAQLAGVEGAAA